MVRKSFGALVALATLAGTVSWVFAQSGSRDYYPEPAPRSQPRQGSGTTTTASEPFEEKFIKYLQQAQYRNWAPLNPSAGDIYDGHSPHGDKVKLYANRAAAVSPDELPSGSILVKENFDSTGTKLMAVTVMYRYKGFAPESGDWHWTKYEANGTVSTMNGMRVSGRVNMCIECHKAAGGDDYVFANDR